ncbi:T9SS type A sorting domain-containing protein [Lacinutrix sp. WUR7]|uniref:T9SS type A sorting domain-containing protein n=1 Tax=Lacinutrix sp. WUR7 TaxID=2653681 RepID=UPI00193CA3D4|nr:T9SS type A sorting domain-containing protein [Lacinutrix sp. WUR7]QRM88139.1 T9SS type A sorting domain-containing protein [Lacinutrix sp. WUR7]
MKTRLLYLMLLVCSISFSQILPSGQYGKFEFTNGSLTNTALNGGPNLSGNTNPTIGPDRNGAANDALVGMSTLNGHTLGATNVNNMTLSFWIKSNSIATQQRILQIYGTAGAGFRFELDNSKLYLISKVGNSTYGVLADWNADETIALTNGQWHNIILRTTPVNYNTELELDVFVDGILQNNISGSADLNGTVINTFLHSAQMVLDPTGTYTGGIDDIYLYKSALSDTQITNLANYYPATNSLTKFYVNANATGSNDGSTWANAYTNLQSAVTNATDGDEIWVASGTYKPAVTNRSTSFDVVVPNLSIYGGFAGTETQLSQRVLGSNETILTGDLNGDDVFVDDHFVNSYTHSSKTDNSYSILNITSLGENLVLDGLTISNTHNHTSTRIGAIFKEKTISNLTVKDCTIKNNISKTGAAGILAEFELNNTSGTTGDLIIENSKFINNMSIFGAGMYVYLGDNTNVDVRVENSLFDNNIAGNFSGDGLSGRASWFISIGTNANMDLKLINNTYVNNLDNSTGSGININSRAVVAINKTAGTINAEVVNCIFWNNFYPGSTTSVKSITNTYNDAVQSLNVRNSIDPLNFNDASITSTTATNTADPLFASSTDFTLQSNSPAKDAGDNTYVTTTSDLLGGQRIFNSIVDMGAYEYGTTLSTNQFDSINNEIKLYPNPTTSVLNIKMNSNLKGATIYSVLGAKVLETKSNTINTSNLKTGLYLIIIEAENGSIATKRFIKQ